MMRKSYDVFALLAALATLAVSVYVLFDSREAGTPKLLMISTALCVLITAIVIAELKLLRGTQRNITTALNNISQGMCMFDSAGRLVLFNDRYLEMYKLSPDVVK